MYSKQVHTKFSPPTSHLTTLKMAVTSIALYTLAVLLIAHSGYSAYEASYNAKLMAQKIAVPIDVSS